MRKRTLMSWLVCCCLLGGVCQFSNAQDLRQRITDQGLLKVIQENENIFQEDARATGVQFLREQNWDIFFNEANRVHARLQANEDNEIQTSAYLYLVPFYRALANDEFRASFLDAHKNIQPFDSDAALEVSLRIAKEGVLDLEEPIPRLKLMIEWYESLNQVRNSAAEDKTAISVEDEKSSFVDTLNNVCIDLAAQTQPGQAGMIASHLRAIALHYGLDESTEKKEGFLKKFDMIGKLNQPLADYALKTADRDDLSYFDKMDALLEGAVALLDLRRPKLIQEEDFRVTENVFKEKVETLWSAVESSDLPPLDILEAKLKYVMVRYNIGVEIWIGTILPPIKNQEEPKSYKTAMQEYRNIAESAEKLIQSGGLDETGTIKAELIALEAQSWVSQLIQDKGRVLSDDYNWDELEVEKDKLLEIRMQVENNSLQTSNKAFELIQKARMHEIEFYHYQYTPESLKQSLSLIEQYAPKILPPLEEPIPAPEGRFDVRVGVGMLVWKAEAHDHLGEFDEAEALFLKIRDLYGDRYRYPDPWTFSFVRHSNQYLENIPKKRAEKEQQAKGGTN